MHACEQQQQQQQTGTQFSGDESLKCNTTGLYCHVSSKSSHGAEIMQALANNFTHKQVQYSVATENSPDNLLKE